MFLSLFFGLVFLLPYGLFFYGFLAHLPLLDLSFVGLSFLVIYCVLGELHDYMSCMMDPPRGFKIDAFYVPKTVRFKHPNRWVL